MHDTHRIRALLDARRPGHTLPWPFLTDPEIYRFDLDAVFARSWIAVGFEREMAEPGSCPATRIGASPVVITRARDSAQRGFHDAGRDRGAQLCAEDDGALARAAFDARMAARGLPVGPSSPEALCAPSTDWYCRKARDDLHGVAPARHLEAAE